MAWFPVSAIVVRGFVAAAVVASLVASPAFAGKADNSVRFGSLFTIANVDPYFNVLTVGNVLADAVWDTLIFRDPQAGEYQGGLATAWRWIDDRTLELDLRQGVTFHNGAGFDADDVVYTLNFVSKPDNRVSNATLVRWIERVEKVGPYRVRIHSRQSFPAALAYLADPRMVIHPHEYYARVGPKGMNEHPVGTGPFRVVEHALGKHVRLERNPSYFSGGPKAPPRIDKVDFRFIPDAQTRVAEMVAGGIDLIWNVARDQAEQLRPIPSLKVVSGQTQAYEFLQMNTLSSTPAPQLRDIRVRQAIAHAIDRKTMAKFLLGEDASTLYTECHPLQFGCDDSTVWRYEYDPLKARRLLAEAGYSHGFPIDLYVFFDRNRAEAIVGYLAAVGIRARMRFMEATALATARRTGRAALIHVAWNPQSIFDASYSVARFHEFSFDDLNRDTDVRDLLLTGNSAADPDVRKDAYAKALNLIAERAYSVPLYSIPIYYLAAKDLVFNAYTDATPRLREMYYE